MADETHVDDNHEDSTPATREWMNLKLASFRSEVRLLFVIAITSNQVLQHISLAPAVGYVGSGLLITGAVVKTVFLRS